VLTVYRIAGTWRLAIAAPGVLGLIWLLVWRRVYHSPEVHPALSSEQRKSIQVSEETEKASSGPTMAALLRMRTTWGIILGRSLTDPYWYFIADWFAIYLASRKVALEAGILGFWLPFLAADAGNFLGGGVSSWLIRRGWNVIAARKTVITIAAGGMLLLIPAAFAGQLPTIVMLFSCSTCCYAAWSTMALTLPSDIYPSRSVASVSGASGSGSGLATIASTWLIGWTADRYSFGPILIVASVIPVLASVLVLLLVRNSEATVR
jgi:ACS family hexuronate transporter-like MFS transporter